MLIDVVRYKLLKQKEKKHRHIEGWCLYYGESKDHDVANYPKKQKKSYYAKNALSEDVSENKTTQSQ